MLVELIVILVTLLLSAYFSGIEIAYFRANRFRIELLSNQGNAIGKLLSKFTHNTSRFITTILIANNLALVLYGRASSFVIEGSLLPAIDSNHSLSSSQLLLIQTVLSTIVVLIIGEYLPKAIVSNYPLIVLRRTARFMNLFYHLLRPLVWITDGFSNFILKRVLGIKNADTAIAFSKRDLHTYIMETIQRVPDKTSEFDAQMFTKALDFNLIKVREFMVPRTEVFALPYTSTLDELYALFVESEHSRLILYEETLDRVVGYIHTRSLFGNPSSIADIMQKVMFVPESMSANTLLKEFNAHRRSMAIVVDEFGGTAGLVTIEDLVEIIFGDIEDEHDEEDEDDLLEQEISPNLYVFSARHEIEYLNNKYLMDLPDGEYTTISGLVMHFAESIPQINETVEIPGFTITVLAATKNKIETVKLRKIRDFEED